jgi:cobalt-zinc-cadmium efflux system protein
MHDTHDHHDHSRHDHDHRDDQGAHDHGHAHIEPSDKRYPIAIALNLGFVIIEGAAGFLANSTALLSDAVHNLSDVLGLAMAGGAALLAKRQASAQRTYGFAKVTILAALANALFLSAACGGLLLEAIHRLANPEPSTPWIVMAVAAAGVVVNGGTAMLFFAGRKGDVNTRGAFLHMAGDAGVSLGVILAGLAIWATGANWIDPAVSILVVALILWTTWDLLRESLDLAMDAAPAHINVDEVRVFLCEQDGVSAVHDLHVWAMGAAEPALTAHLVRAAGGDDAFLARVTDGLAHHFKIEHVTLQIETEHRADCAQHP